jgi:hypothetical protein
MKRNPGFLTKFGFLNATLYGYTLALSRFDQIDVSSLEVADEERLTAPRKVEVFMPAEAVVQDPLKQSVVSVAYLMVNQIKEDKALAEVGGCTSCIQVNPRLDSAWSHLHQPL